MKVLGRTVSYNYDDKITVEMTYEELAQLYLALGVLSDARLESLSSDHLNGNPPASAYPTFSKIAEELRGGGFLK